MSLKEKLTEALLRQENDVTSFYWKFAKEEGKDAIRLVDASEEQLKEFRNHCHSMLYSTDKKYPGRFTLLKIIENYQDKCNAELLLRYMENGNNFQDGRSFPRYTLYQQLNNLTDNEGVPVPEESLKHISISTVIPGLPREFDTLTIALVKEACVDKLGSMSFKHITYSFLYGLGVYLTPEENKSLFEKDAEGKKRNKLDVLKERLFIHKGDNLRIKSTGLSLYELKTMLEMKQVSKFSSKKYSSFTNDELYILRNKVLFRLEQKIKGETEIWETKMNQIDKVLDLKEQEL